MATNETNLDWDQPFARNPEMCFTNDRTLSTFNNFVAKRVDDSKKAQHLSLIAERLRYWNCDILRLMFTKPKLSPIYCWSRHLIYDCKTFGWEPTHESKSERLTSFTVTSLVTALVSASVSAPTGVRSSNKSAFHCIILPIVAFDAIRI